MKELDVVRVINLNVPERHLDGTEHVKRQPKVGDIGTIVHIADDLSIVESVDDDGYTVWLADFAPDEIEELD